MTRIAAILAFFAAAAPALAAAAPEFKLEARSHDSVKVRGLDKPQQGKPPYAPCLCLSPALASGLRHCQLVKIPTA